MATTIEAGVEVKAKEDVSKVFKGMSNVAVGAFKAMVAAAALVSAAIVAITIKAANMGDAMFNMSKKVGASSEFLSEMAFAAGQTGTSLAMVEKGMLKVSKNVVTGAKDFKKWGLELKKSNGQLKNTEELFLDAAEKVKSLENPVLKAAAAQDLFGRSGAEMIQLLNQGKEGIEALRDQAEDAGITISTASSIISNEFNNRLGAAKDTLGATIRIIGERFIPLSIVLLKRIQSMAQAFNKWAKANKDLLDAGIIETVLWLAETGLPAVLTMTQMVADAYLSWKLAVAVLTENFNTMFADIIDGYLKILRFLSKLQEAAGLGDTGMARATKNLVSETKRYRDSFVQAQKDASAEISKTQTLMAKLELALGRVATHGAGALRKALMDSKKLVQELLKVAATPVAPGPGLPDEKPLTPDEVAAYLSRLKDIEAREKARLQQRTGRESRAANLADIRNARREQEALTKSTERYARTLGVGLVSSIRSMVTGAKTFGDVMLDALDRIGTKFAELAAMAFFQFLLNLLFPGLGSGLGGIVGAIGGAFGLPQAPAGAGAFGTTSSALTSAPAAGPMHVTVEAPMNLLATPNRAAVDQHFHASVMPAVDRAVRAGRSKSSPRKIRGA